MLDFEEELKRLEPGLTLEEVEKAVYQEDQKEKTDTSELLKALLEDGR